MQTNAPGATTRPLPIKAGSADGADCPSVARTRSSAARQGGGVGVVAFIADRGAFDFVHTDLDAKDVVLVPPWPQKLN